MYFIVHIYGAFTHFQISDLTFLKTTIMVISTSLSCTGNLQFTKTCHESSYTILMTSMWDVKCFSHLIAEEAEAQR